MTVRPIGVALLVAVVALGMTPPVAKSALAAAEPDQMEGCTAWGVHSAGVGPTTCTWEAESFGGAYAAGLFRIRIFRDGQWGGPQGTWVCAPGPGPLTKAIFEPGDLVEVTALAGWITVGPHAGMVC